MLALQVSLAAAVVVSGIGATTDLRTGHIPNWLTFGAAGIAPLAWAGYGFATGGQAGAVGLLAWSLFGLGVGIMVPLILFYIGAMFGGDVKLLAALGAIVHPRLAFEIVTFTFIAALFLSIAKLIWDRNLLRVLGNTWILVTNPFLPEARRKPLTHEMMTIMRFGPAIFVGVLVSAIGHWSDSR